ncbi:hypothetical protein HMN09_00800700 [Mycena chlorophos]|uniref:Uncharacterized protein n=1 Tax=Mycena chlorophos TaxID=658473 RepID=A0A8H6SU86_MYCCL|nr:hypothetical protein HMN09_00800700 [Mycena chlorophos]
MSRFLDTHYNPNNPRRWRPVVSTSAPERLRQLFGAMDIDDTRDTADTWPALSSLARTIVESQIQAHDAYVAERTRPSVPTLVELASSRLPSTMSTDEIEEIPSHLWSSLPYPAYRRAVHRAAERAESEPPTKRGKGTEGQNYADIDEWILAQEKRLVYNKHRSHDWRQGLVNLDDEEAIFPDSTLTTHGRVLTRPGSLSGFLVLGALRHPHICIQPSTAAFRARFENLTGGLLNGLDWSNIFIAGGIVLGSLYSVESPQSSVKDKDLESSDIDMYIYGLDPDAANAKIKHIFKVYKKNLPSKAETLVVRNSKTITFYHKYPTRRIQIVLRFLKTPKDVLLNFDLDICAMGWDGWNFWMLPRAARALETGYSVFTMSLIQGHYLSERRATQEERVFKYGYRGYGIRILPSYIDSLKTSKEDLSSIARSENLLPLDIEHVADRARQWTRRVITATYGLLGRRDHPLRCNPTDLENGRQVSSEPQDRSCLSGLSLFMRHVGLWEMERREEVQIENRTWALASYGEDSPLAYDDTPNYSWDPNFSIQNFKVALDDFNHSNIVEWMAYSLDGQIADCDFRDYDADYLPPKLSKLQRATYAKDAAGVLGAKSDITMAIILPANFAQFANELVSTVMSEHGQRPQPILTPVNEEVADAVPADDDATLRLYIWRIPLAIIWQQLDRRKDEVFEALFAFYRAHDQLVREWEQCCPRLVTNLSRRVINPEVDDEFSAFARWVGRRPVFFEEFYRDTGNNLADPNYHRSDDEAGDGDEDGLGDEEW